MIDKATSLSSLSLKIREAIGEVQALGIHVENEDAVVQYLLRYPEMASLVVKTCRIVRENLDDAQLTLTHYIDPEIEGYDYLLLKARFEEYASDILDRIEQVESLYLDELAQQQGWLLLTTDFVQSNRLS